MSSYTPGQLNTTDSFADFATTARVLTTAHRTLVLVPTWGGLHAGHTALIRAGRRIPGATVIAAIISDGPWDREADLGLLAREGVELAFVTTVEEFRAHCHTGLTFDGAGRELLAGEGTRLNDVLRLMTATRPAHVMVGEKDYPLAVGVSRLAAEYSLGSQVHAVPTVRFADGVAVARRVADVSEDGRAQAIALSAALMAGAMAGQRGPEAVREATVEVLEGQGVRGAQVSVCAPDLGPAPQEGDARIVVSAGVDGVLLADVLSIYLGDVEGSATVG